MEVPLTERKNGATQLTLINLYNQMLKYVTYQKIWITKEQDYHTTWIWQNDYFYLEDNILSPLILPRR